jgi:hypothetical protein
LAKSLLNWKGIVILASTFVIWVYIILILELGSAEISYTFESLYYPSFFEQAIFAMIGIECLGIYLRRGTSIILSAIFYEAYYFVVLINSLPGFPGIYAPFFVIDSFAVGIIYIGIYSVTRSIYFAMALQLSLILMAIFIPPIPAAFFYTLVPS